MQASGTAPTMDLHDWSAISRLPDQASTDEGAACTRTPTPPSGAFRGGRKD